MDERDAEGGVPEADGVLAATRQHMSFMPLELFDNIEYEQHTPEEWVELGKEQGVSFWFVCFLLRDVEYERFCVLCKSL